MISEDSTSIHGDDFSGGKITKKSSKSKSSRRKTNAKSDKRRSKGLTQKEIVMKKKRYEYRSGLVNIPSYEVIEDSVHVQTGTIDLQFCDDIPGEREGWRE